MINYHKKVKLKITNGKGKVKNINESIAHLLGLYYVFNNKEIEEIIEREFKNNYELANAAVNSLNSFPLKDENGVIKIELKK